MMATAGSRLAALADVGALLEVLSEDERPTFILELTDDSVPSIVFRNAALTTFITHINKTLAFEDMVAITSAKLTAGGTNCAAFCGTEWSSKHFRGAWRLISCDADVPKQEEIGPFSSERRMQPTVDSVVSTSTRTERLTNARAHLTFTAPTNTLTQTAGNSFYSPATLSPPTPLSPCSTEKLRKGLADWTLADAISPWFHFVKHFPWADTPFGPIDSWSLELRRSTAKTMNSPEPRVLIFGEQRAIMYNKAFAAIIGHHHPNCLGLPLADVQVDKIFDILQYMAQSAYEDGKGSQLSNQELLVERNGSEEQTFWNIFLSPLPGVDGYCDSVVGEFTEITELVMRDQRRIQGVDIFESISKVDTLPELWSELLGALENDAPDISYAVVYTALDQLSLACPDALPTPDDTPLPTPLEPSVSGHVAQYQLTDSIGLSESLLDLIINLSATDSLTRPSLVDAFLEAVKTKEIISIQNETLPRELSVEIPGVGRVSSACILPISDLNSKPLAFVVLGIDPRRPYNEQTSRFIYYIREAICKHAILITLPEEQRNFQRKYEATTMALSHELRLSILKAKKKEEKFLRIAKSAPLGMYLYSPKEKTIQVNDAYLQITGTSKENLNKESTLGLPWLQTVSQEFLDLAVKEWEHLMTHKTPSAIEYKIRAQSDDSNPRWVSATSFPDLDEHGEVYLIHGWLVDISDRLAKETLLAQRLEDALETKKTTEHFLDMLSHELRNPLSAILQCADEIIEITRRHLTQSAPPIDAETLRPLEDAAETIALCARHQKSIFDDVLTVSKLDSQLLTIMPEKVRPVDVVQKALKMYEQEARTSDIDTCMDVQDTYAKHISEFVMLDPNRLLQIIINLLTNAIKHTRECKERSIRISIGASLAEPNDDTSQFAFMPPTPKKPNSPLTPCTEQDQFSAAFEYSKAGEELFLHIAVQDTGCGLSPNEMGLLFKRFSQPKTYGQYGGSGLGLFLSKELIELQGGRIGVRSTENVGTSFSFYIRCRRFMSESELPSGVQPNLEKTHRPRMSRTEAFDVKDLGFRRQPSTVKGLHVLAVDDNNLNLRVMAKQLRNAGCVVDTANHGLDALTLLITATTAPAASAPDPLASTTLPTSTVSTTYTKFPDIVLMDIEMPVMDGLTCIREIRKLEMEEKFRGRLPIIAVTANARGEQIDQAMEAGADGVVTKPFRIGELVGVMGESVEGKA